jgi:hypothetical protein
VTVEREPVVMLNEMEMILGGLCGLMRAASAIFKKRENRARGIDDDGNIWTRHVEGALAELAVAKALNVFWAGAAGDDWRRTKPDGGDVGKLQVRSRNANYLDQKMRLIVQHKDRADEDFLLVVGRAPTYRLVGWINAGEAKRHEEWIANPGNFGEAWFVPQEALNEVKYL